MFVHHAHVRSCETENTSNKCWCSCGRRRRAPNCARESTEVQMIDPHGSARLTSGPLCPPRCGIRPTANYAVELPVLQQFSQLGRQASWRVHERDPFFLRRRPIERLPLAHRCIARPRRKAGPTCDVANWKKRRKHRLRLLETTEESWRQRARQQWTMVCGLDHWPLGREGVANRRGQLASTARHDQNSSQSQLGRRRKWISGDKITVQSGPYHSHVAWDCEVSV